MARYSRRHRSREWVLRALYAREMDPSAGDDVLDVLLEHDPPREIDRDFARRLFGAVLRQGARRDADIGQRLRNWDISRLALIDLLLLRLALAEFELLDDVPEEVTLNEVIELAKRYSGPEAGSFVNGILDAIRRERAGSRPPSTDRAGADR